MKEENRKNYKEKEKKDKETNVEIYRMACEISFSLGNTSTVCQVKIHAINLITEATCKKLDLRQSRRAKSLRKHVISSKLVILLWTSGQRGTTGNERAKNS